MRRRGGQREIPPPLELECLKALWRIGAGTVKDVREVVTENRNLAYTTVMTILERLERRGSVAREKIGRSFLYTPRLDRQELRRLAVQSLIETFFDGSKEDLQAYLLGAPPRQPESAPAPGVAASPAAEPLEPELL